MLIAMILHVSHWFLEDEFCDIDTVQDSLLEDMDVVNFVTNLQSVKRVGQFCETI